MQKKAPLYNSYHSSQGHQQTFYVLQVRNHKGSHLWGGADRTGDPILTNTTFHAMHIRLSLKLGDHEGLALFVNGCLLKRTLLLVLPAILIQVLIRAFLSPVPVCCGIQSATSWCCPAAAGGTPAPGTQLWETQCRFSVFCFISVVINIISVIRRAVFISNL